MTCAVKHRSGQCHWLNKVEAHAGYECWKCVDPLPRKGQAFLPSHQVGVLVSMRRPILQFEVSAFATACRRKMFTFRQEWSGFIKIT